MDPERWRQVEELYHSAVERPQVEREAYLAAACGGDAELRREVDSLLAQQSVDTPLDHPAMDLAAGSRLGPYELLEPIGHGGMGAVFKARDARLNRNVAIKVSTAQFSGRFANEARSVAALNHPNICTLHDVGPNYLVMELVEGADLAGPVPIETAIGYARQIAAGLEAAHEKGIIHRDLKPANIKLTREGTVKILDFGLAKATAATASPTPALTESGMILGTAAYMSPEQARGEHVDKRADIWAFGVVFYEMLTGKRLFGDSTNLSDAIAAVLTREPDFNALPKGTPPRVRRLLELCLRKDPKQRLRDIGDVRIRLVESEPEVPASSMPARRWPWAAGFAALGVLGALTFSHFRERPSAPAAPIRFQIQVPEDASGSNALSPDGRKLAFVAGGRLWVHSLGSGESRELEAFPIGVPFWSPDGEFIGYPSAGKLAKIAAAGGSPQTLTNLRAGGWTGGAWSKDDVIVFGDRQVGLFRIPASGGVPVQITALDRASHEYTQYGPSFLPDGQHFVYVRSFPEDGKSAIYLGSLDAKAEQQSSRPLVACHSQAEYAPSADPSTGYLVYVREGTLMAQSFDNRRLEIKGQAVPVVERVSENTGGARWVHFSTSANDILALPRRSGYERQLSWIDRAGKVLGTFGEVGLFGVPALSPDGLRVAVAKARAADAGNLWLLDLARGGGGTRFSFGPTSDSDPVWSPDGSRVIFGSNRDGPRDLYQKLTNGVKDEEVLFRSGQDKRPTSWSRDGRLLLYEVTDERANSDIWVLPLESGKKPIPFLKTEFNERQARFSPDGRWVAYTSNESGRDEVYVRRFSMNAAGTAVEAGSKWPISNGFGVEPRWRGDGGELIFRSTDQKLTAVTIATNPVFRAGNPETLGRVTSVAWEVAADGKRFLVAANKSGQQAFTVIMNWQEGLKQR